MTKKENLNTKNIQHVVQEINNNSSFGASGDKYSINDILPDKNTWLYDIESFAQTFMVTYKKANKKEYVVFIKNGPSDELPDFVKKHCLDYCKKRIGSDAKIDIRPVSQLPAFYLELEKNNAVLTGFNNSSYDSNIISVVLSNATAKNLCNIVHEVNEDLVTKGLFPWQSPMCKKYIDKDNAAVLAQKNITEPDLMLDLVEFFGLKRTQASIGENIEETNVPFDIPKYTVNEDIKKQWMTKQKERGIKNIEKLVDSKWMTLTPEGLAETLYYNISDTNQTNRLLSYRYGWYKTKLQASKGIVNKEGELIVKGSKDLAHKTNAASSEAAFYKKPYGKQSVNLPSNIHFDTVWLNKNTDMLVVAFKLVHNYYSSQPIFLRDRRPNEDITKSTNKKYNLVDGSNKKNKKTTKLEPSKLTFFPEKIDCYKLTDNEYKDILSKFQKELNQMNATYHWEVQKMSDPKAKEKGEFFVPESIMRWRLYNDLHPITDFNEHGHDLEKEYDLKAKRLMDPKEQYLQEIKNKIDEIKTKIPPKTTKIVGGKSQVYYLSELEGMKEWEIPFDPIYKNLESGILVSEKERLESTDLKSSIKVTENSKWVKSPSFNKNDRKLLYGARSVLWNYGDPLEQQNGFGGIHSAILNFIWKPTEPNSWLKVVQQIKKEYDKKKSTFKTPKDFDAFFDKIDNLNKTQGFEHLKNVELEKLIKKYGSVANIPSKEYNTWKTKYYDTCKRFNDELNQFKYGKCSTVDVASLYPSIIALRAKRLFPNDPYFQAGLYADLKKLRVSLKKTNADVAAVLKIWLNGFYGKLLYPNGKAFSPQGQFGIIAEGQLALLKLKDMLYKHCKEIQSNTDGYYFQPKAGHEEICKKIHGYDYIDKDGKKQHYKGEWETLTGLDLEFEEHDFIIQADVNNYIMGNIDPKTKEIDTKSIKSKGFFSSYNWIEKYHTALKNFADIKDKNDVIAQLEAFDKVGLPMQFLSKNSMTIVNRITALALMYDKKPEDLIKKETDPLYFQQLVKLSSKYDYLKQGDQNLRFKENRIIATKSNTGPIYKFKKGEPTDFKEIFTINEKNGNIKFIKEVEKFFNNWVDEKTYNILNNPEEHEDIINLNNFTQEEIDLINDNVWSDELITKYTVKEQEVLDPADIEEKQKLIDLFDKFEEVLVASYDKSDKKDIKKKSTNILKEEFVNEIKAGKVDGIKSNADGGYTVNVGFIQSIYQNTPSNGGVLCYKTKDPITKKEWKIENGFLILPDGTKHEMDYDFYLNMVYQRLYSINPKKYLTPENIKKYKPDGKNAVFLKDIDKEIENAKKRLEAIKKELEQYQEWKKQQVKFPPAK